MVALNTNIINMDKRFRGTIVGLLNAFFAGSPSVFATIYVKAEPKPENIRTIKLMCFICHFVDLLLFKSH
jgi:hypothetical protein